ncbi:amino acid adenylation domain-containing protein [Streptomyces finlayi]|uniref:Amino acid adenylation domain-containing protein n=1 Tax=Streptomyces finlayi TaxID=67296 RepID=A0A7G7BIP4_9ACTN|nr:amino acid adenylation domain-containing protein [Streptomyces finlayi]QNE75209.1 amino acid adenylation domain-containing protein [Streptomyces finlayi]
MPPARRHALTVRLPEGAADTPISAALTAAADLWWPEDSRPRLWTDSVRAAADSSAALRRRATETRRPLAPGHRLRALFLRYEDGGAADLLLVADGAALDARSLWLIAEVLRGRLDPQGVLLRSGTPDLRPDPSTLPLVAALAVVTGRHEGLSYVPVGIPVPALDRPPHALGALDGRAVFAADLTEERTVGDLLGTPLTPFPDGAAPDVGLVDPGPAAGQEAFTVLPYTDPPYPRTLLHGPRALTDGPGPLTDETGGFERQVLRVRDQILSLPPETPLAELYPLTAEESAARIGLGRGTPATAHTPRRIDDVFTERTAAQPDAPALTCAGATLTYRELNARADELANGLRASGVAPGDLVGICLPRSTDLVATMLAVLKADAVYVPLDPEHPAGRRARTAEDAGLRLTVDDTARLTGHPAQPRTASGPPTAPAYVIHTSGSTGRPKGVVVPHANVTALVDATREDFGLTSADTWTLFHSAAFDFSVWEIWGALLTGGRLVVVDHWTTRSPDGFHALVLREGVTVLSQTPSAFTQFMAADRDADGELPLRLVVLGGEPLDTRPLRSWFDRHPEDRCRLVNMFGITETTVHVTARTLTRRAAVEGSRSVGRPLPGWDVHVLDSRGRPVPPGAPGEIYVGGAGVADGYLHRPALTAERFVPAPWHDGRLYRSGDLGRFLPDGSLEHLGRIDDQVKVRGFRIEPGEIRHALLEDPAVTAAAVTVTGHEQGDAAAVRIDAYVVLTPDAHGDTAPVRHRAARLLPSHMLPATVTALPRLPLTANGKLDPAGLPAPRRSAPEAAAPLLAPAPPTGAAATLTEVWQEVLGVPAIGPDDNFWDLGGNSLYAIRIGAAVRERGLPPVPLRQLYLTPTIRTLSEALVP